jgi:hypothetical protein
VTGVAPARSASVPYRKLSAATSAVDVLTASRPSDTLPRTVAVVCPTGPAPVVRAPMMSS